MINQQIWSSPNFLYKPWRDPWALSLFTLVGADFWQCPWCAWRDADRYSSRYFQSFPTIICTFQMVQYSSITITICKSPFLIIGKPSINGHFSIAMLVYQRVIFCFNRKFKKKTKWVVGMLPKPLVSLADVLLTTKRRYPWNFLYFTWMDKRHVCPSAAAIALDLWKKTCLGTHIGESKIRRIASSRRRNRLV